MSKALKKQGELTYLILSRRVPVDAPDAEGLAEPQNERIRYKVVGNPSSASWQKKLGDFVKGNKTSWDLVTVDI